MHRARFPVIIVNGPQVPEESSSLMVMTPSFGKGLDVVNSQETRLSFTYLLSTIFETSMIALGVRVAVAGVGSVKAEISAPVF
jgi:hypothetical protein